MREGVIIKYNKEFVKGNQYLDINSYDGKAFQQEVKSYYWQSREIFNIIAPMVEYIKKEVDLKLLNRDVEINPDVKKFILTDKILYGKGSIVERLIPYQRQYNALRNRNIEYLNRLTYPCLFVEDGSVDIDSLEEEGLHPGKILVYRQGATIPEIKVTSTIEFYNKLKEEAEEVKQEMWNIVYNYLENNF